MDFCPLCNEAIYLDPDEPHVLRCILKYGIFVRVGEWRDRWRWWSRALS